MSASDDDESETKRLKSEQQQQQQQQQPSFFFFLAEELIAEILSWLPVDSLNRFKCVSKSWNSLISNPSFIQLHFHKSSKLTHRLILFRSTTPFYHRSTLTYFLQNPSSPFFSSSHKYFLRLNQNRLDQNSFVVFGSCNGLVCLFFIKGHGYDSHLLLWNPATRLLSQKFPFFFPFPRRWRKFGFGYDKSSHTYKVVCISCDYDFNAIKDSDRTQATNVYTLRGGGGGGDGGWREIQRFPGFPFYIRDRTEGTFLSGTLNWVAIRNYLPSPFEGLKHDYDDVAIHEYVIVSLDLGTEAYKQFSLPPFGRDDMPGQMYFHPEMEVFLDCLCLSYDYWRTHFIMWQMKEFGVEKSWTRFVKVSYQHLQHPRIRVTPIRMALMCISENGDVFILHRTQKNYFESYSEIIMYNRRDNSVQLAPAPTISNHRYEISVKGYAQSLISPC